MSLLTTHTAKLLHVVNTTNTHPLSNDKQQTTSTIATTATSSVTPLPIIDLCILSLVVNSPTGNQYRHHGTYIEICRLKGDARGW